MENDVMDNEIASTGTDGQELSQSGMQDSFTEQFQVVDDEGTPIEQPTEEVKPNPEPASQQAQPAKQPEVPAKPAVVDYAAELHNPDGSLNVEKALELFGTKNEPEQARQPIVTPQPAAPQQPAAAPAAPEDPYQQMKKTYTAALELQRYYMSAEGGGYDPANAMALAERDIDSHLKESYFKSQIQQLRDDVDSKLKAKDQEIKEARELAIAEPIAERNLINTVAKYAKGMSAETLRNAIFDQKLGGKFFTDLFVIANPDKEKLIGKELDKAMNDWFVRSASKNQRFVETLAINAINQIQRLVQPELAKLIQKNALERKGIQQATKPGPQTAQRPAVSNQGGQASILDQFFHDAPREMPAGRPHI